MPSEGHRSLLSGRGGLGRGLEEGGLKIRCGKLHNPPGKFMPGGNGNPGKKKAVPSLSAGP